MCGKLSHVLSCFFIAGLFLYHDNIQVFQQNIRKEDHPTYHMRQWWPSDGPNMAQRPPYLVQGCPSEGHFAFMTPGGNDHCHFNRWDILDSIAITMASLCLSNYLEWVRFHCHCSMLVTNIPSMLQQYVTWIFRSIPIIPVQYHHSCWWDPTTNHHEIPVNPMNIPQKKHEKYR